MPKKGSQLGAPVKHLILLLSILIFAPAAASSAMYRWVDDDGVLHFSDRPPRKVAEPTPAAPPVAEVTKEVAPPAAPAEAAPAKPAPEVAVDSPASVVPEPQPEVQPVPVVEEVAEVEVAPAAAEIVEAEIAPVVEAEVSPVVEEIAAEVAPVVEEVVEEQAPIVAEGLPVEEAVPAEALPMDEAVEIAESEIVEAENAEMAEVMADSDLENGLEAEVVEQAAPVVAETKPAPAQNVAPTQETTPENSAGAMPLGAIAAAAGVGVVALLGFVGWSRRSSSGGSDEDAQASSLADEMGLDAEPVATQESADSDGPEVEVFDEEDSFPAPMEAGSSDGDIELDDDEASFPAPAEALDNDDQLPAPLG